MSKSSALCALSFYLIFSTKLLQIFAYTPPEINKFLVGIHKPCPEALQDEIHIATGLLITPRWLLARESFKTPPFQTEDYFAFLLSPWTDPNLKMKQTSQMNSLAIRPIRKSPQRLVVTWVTSPFYNVSGYGEDNLALLQLEFDFTLQTPWKELVPINLKELHGSTTNKGRKQWRLVYFNGVGARKESILYLKVIDVQVKSRLQCLQEAQVKGVEMDSNMLGYNEMCVVCSGCGATGATAHAHNESGIEVRSGGHFDQYDGVLLLNDTPFALYSRILHDEEEQMRSIENQIFDADTERNGTLLKPLPIIRNRDNETQLLIFTRLDVHWDFVRGIIPSLIDDDLVSKGNSLVVQVCAEYKPVCIGLVIVLLFLI